MEYIVFDLEATCWPNRGLEHERETIEIGALKLDGYGEVTGTFNQFIRPILHPFLSPYCQDLTTIRQEEVERAGLFPDVIEAFQDWMELWDGNGIVLCSWGGFDKRQLAQDCRLHDLEDDWLSPHINLKRQYQEIRRLRRPVGLKNAVEREGFEFTGTHHRGIDDAENLAKIFVKYLDEWRW